MKKLVIVLLIVLSLALLSTWVVSTVREANHQKLQKIQLQQEKTDLEMQLEQKSQEYQKLEQEKIQSDEGNRELQEKNRVLEDQLSKKRERDAANLALAKSSVKVASSVRVSGKKYIGGVCEKYRSLFVQYNWDVEVAMAVATQESGCYDFASSPTNDHGVMQIHNGLDLYGQAIYDPAYNIMIAYTVKYVSRGWQPWSAYTSGKYLRFLSS